MFSVSIRTITLLAFRNPSVDNMASRKEHFCPLERGEMLGFPSWLIGRTSGMAARRCPARVDQPEDMTF